MSMRIRHKILSTLLHMKMLEKGKSSILGVGEDSLSGIKGMLQALNNFIPIEKAVICFLQMRKSNMQLPKHGMEYGK